MNTDASDPIPRGRFRWYQLYFALAAFDLITIGFSLYLNHRLMGIHAESVAVDQVWAERLNRLSELGRMVGKMGAPGDDVFASHQPKMEAANMKAAEVAVNAALAAAEAELIKSVAATEGEAFRAIFTKVRTGVERVSTEGALIFSAFETGDRDKAGAHMAAMDRDLGAVDEVLVELTGKIRDIQSERFREQLAQAHALQRFEFVLGGAVILMISAATIFGHKMASTMRAAEAAQTQHLAVLQIARDQLEHRVAERTKELTALNTSLMREVDERERAVIALSGAQEEISNSARRAGRAEIATGVLFNVRTVLNSVNASAGVVAGKLRQSEVPKLAKAASLLVEKNGSLAQFLTEDPSGREMPGYLAKLGEQLIAENASMLTEVEQLGRNIAHIKEVVGMQKSYKKVSGVIETLPLDGLVEEAIEMHCGAFERHGVVVERHFSPAPPARVDRHKVSQILINLLRNAKSALDDVDGRDKRITISIQSLGEFVKIVVADNGIGIPAENLGRIFGEGFSTREGGHGLGLHSAANAAKEMGGSLTVASAGKNRGATFTLQLPAEREAMSASL